MEKNHQNSSSNKIPAAPPSDCSRSLFTMQGVSGGSAPDDLKGNTYRHSSGLKQKNTLSSNTNSSSTLHQANSSLNTSVALNQSHIPMTPKAVMGKRDFHNAAPLPQQGNSSNQHVFQRYKSSYNSQLRPKIIAKQKAQAANQRSVGCKQQPSHNQHYSMQYLTKKQAFMNSSTNINDESQINMNNKTIEKDNFSHNQINTDDSTLFIQDRNSTSQDFSPLSTQFYPQSTKNSTKPFNSTLNISSLGNDSIQFSPIQNQAQNLQQLQLQQLKSSNNSSNKKISKHHYQHTDGKSPQTSQGQQGTSLKLNQPLSSSRKQSSDLVFQKIRTSQQHNNSMQGPSTTKNVFHSNHQMQSNPALLSTIGMGRTQKETHYHHYQNNSSLHQHQSANNSSGVGSSSKHYLQNIYGSDISMPSTTRNSQAKKVSIPKPKLNYSGPIPSKLLKQIASTSQDVAQQTVTVHPSAQDTSINKSSTHRNSNKQQQHQHISQNFQTSHASSSSQSGSSAMLFNSTATSGLHKNSLASTQRQIQSAAADIPIGTSVQSLNYPITAAKALQKFMTSLTDYQKGQILDYNNIYFVGQKAKKIKASPLLKSNYGYDDQRGDYNVVIGDHIAYRYQVIKPLGKGSFGQALKCFDHKRGQFIALKIIRNKKRFHHQAAVQVKILQTLKKHDPSDTANVVKLREFIVFRKHLCITFELLSINLYEFIKNNNFKGVSTGLIRRFAIQILQSLRYMRRLRVIHCDLKPENILLKSPNKSGIKVIDFGSSCLEDERVYTYIQSRFYRAPQIILGIPYTMAIDMWSFGCILAELFTGYPLFPGENQMEQLALMMEMKGVPDDDILAAATRKKYFFDPEGRPIIVQNSRGKKRKPNTKDMAHVMRCRDKNFLDFLNKCLEWNPEKRFTPEQALRHEWILQGLPPKLLKHHQMMGTTSNLGLNSGSQTQKISNQQVQGQFSTRGSHHEGAKQISLSHKSTNQSMNADSDVALNQTYNFHKGHATNLLIDSNTISSSMLKQAFMQGAQAAAAVATGRNQSNSKKQHQSHKFSQDSITLQSARNNLSKQYNSALDDFKFNSSNQKNIINKPNQCDQQQTSSNNQLQFSSFHHHHTYGVPMSATNNSKKHFDFGNDVILSQKTKINNYQNNNHHNMSFNNGNPKRTDSTKRMSVSNIVGTHSLSKNSATSSALQSQRHYSNASISKTGAIVSSSGANISVSNNPSTSASTSKDNTSGKKEHGLPPIEQQQQLQLQQQQQQQQQQKQLYYSSKLYAGLATQRYSKQMMGQKSQQQQQQQ